MLFDQIFPKLVPFLISGVFGEEIVKEAFSGVFGVKKCGKQQNLKKTLKCTEGDGVTGFNVTTSGTTEVKKLEVTHDGPEGFWLIEAFFVTASEEAVRSGTRRRDDVKKAITKP